MANTNDNSNNQDLPPPPDGTNTPNPAEEDIDAQLNALECEPFTEEEVHQMMQKIRVRILMEKLRARDQAMIDLMQFLSLPGQEPASDTMPAAGFRGAAASSNAIATSRLESRLSSGPPVVPTETGIDKSPFSRSTEACKRRRPDPKPRKKGWVPNKAIVSLILGMAVISNVVWSQAFRTQTNHGKKEAQRVAASRLITEEIVKAQCLIEGPQLLPLPRRVNAKQQEMLQNTLVIFLNFINKNFDDPFLKKDRAETQYWAANIYLHLAEYEKAKACFPQAIAMLRELAAEQRSIPHLQRSLAECYLNYGVILARLEPSDHLQAERVLGQALTQWHKLQGKYPDDTTYKLGLAAAHNAIGELFIDTRRPDEAEKSYRQAAEFLEEVVKDLPPQSPQRSWLANHHQNRGKLLVATNQLRQARHEYEKALEILAELPRDCPNISEYRNDLATQFNLLGNEFVHEKDMREAEGSYGQARKIMEALVADFPSVGKYHTNLGVAIHQLGSLAYEVGNNPKARRLAIQAFECQQKAVALEPLSVSAKKALRDSWIHRATVAIHQRNHWEAAWA